MLISDNNDEAGQDIHVEKIVAVHLHGKRKKVAKVYMALVSHIDNEDVHLRYMAKSGSMYCLSDETNSIDIIANMKKILADVNNNSPTTKLLYQP